MDAGVRGLAAQGDQQEREDGLAGWLRHLQLQGRRRGRQAGPPGRKRRQQQHQLIKPVFGQLHKQTRARIFKCLWGPGIDSKE